MKSIKVVEIGNISYLPSGHLKFAFKNICAKEIGALMPSKYADKKANLMDGEISDKQDT